MKIGIAKGTVISYTYPIFATLGGVLILIAIGGLATVAQLLMTWSFNHLPIVAGSLLSLLTPIFNVVLGAVIFRETMTFPEAIGTGLILLSRLGVAALGKEPIALRR